MRTPIRALALATALATATTGLVATPAHADDAATKPCTAEDITTTGATLEWNFKDSFISYVLGFAEGTITPSDGLVFKAPKGPMTFTASELPDHWWATPGTVIPFHGTVNFKAHKGAATGGGWGLDSTMTDVKLKVLTPTTAVITADYDVKGNVMGVKDATAKGDDQPIVDLTFNAPVEKAATFQNIVMKSHAARGGVEMSGGNYPLGKKLSPAVLKVSNAGDCNLMKAEDPGTYEWEQNSSDFSAAQRTEGSATFSSGKDDDGASTVHAVGSSIAGVLAVFGLVGAAVAAAFVHLPQLPGLPPLPEEIARLLPRR